jgi:hypothetical protein
MIRELEQAISKEIISSKEEELCGGCGKPYNFAQRCAEVKGTLGEDSKKRFCKYECWKQESYSQEIA